MANANHMNKYEKARLIGARAFQIAEGAPLALELSDDELDKLNYNPIQIAKYELEKGVIPLEVLENAKESEILEEIKVGEEELEKVEEETEEKEE